MGNFGERRINPVRLMEELKISNIKMHKHGNPDILTFKGTYGTQHIIARCYKKENDLAKMIKIAEDIADQHIHRYIGKTPPIDNRNYYIFEGYTYNLRELKKVDASTVHCKDDENKKLYTFFLTCDSEPTEGFRVVLRDIVDGMCELQGKEHGHGDLNENNVVIQLKNNKRVIAKLTGMVDHGERLATVLRRDLVSLGKIIKFCLQDSEGSTGSEEWLDLTSRILGDRSQFNQLELKKAQALESNFIVDARIILRHPLFWTPDKCVVFIQKVVSFVKACKKRQQSWCKDIVNGFLTELESIPSKYWAERMHDEMITLPNPMYDPGLVRDLLRFIRNKSCHFAEETLEIQQRLGRHPVEFYNYFRVRYPILLLETYKAVVLHFPNLQHCQIVEENYFDDYLIRGNR